MNATTGAITYTPATGFYGTDTFRYTVADTDGVVSTPATVTVTVDAPPVAVADSAVTPENQAVSVAVLANDSDPVGTINPASVTVSTAAAHGTTAVNATTGVITYTPASGFYGTDTFQYTVANTLGAASAPAAVTVTVTPLTGSGYVDGASGAPAGTPPLPAILSSYAVRPPWEVAGVDYAVGVPSGTTLKDPSTIAMAGVSVNTTNHTITVTGNNVTLNGYNFGMANGYEVIVQGVNDTIENSEFVVGPNQGSHGTVLNVTASASNFSLLDNEINGNNVAVTPEVGSTISIASSGTLTIQYNYLHNSGGDMIDLNASNAAQVDLIQYNLFANIGVNTAHADTIQWYNTTTGAGSDIGFNTVYQNVNQPGPGNGALVPLAEGPNATMTGLTVNNDTIVQTAADVTGNFSTGFYADSGGVASNIVIHDLYIDPTGPLGYTGSPWFPTGYYGINLAHPMALSNVINMVTGAQIPVPSSSSKTAQGYYTYADASGYSPALSDVYSVTASQTSGTLTPGSTISFTVNLDENFTVTGTPTLSLNDGGTATYSGGSGSNALTFSYTVARTDKTVSALAITGVTLPTGATVKDAVGNTANLAGAVATFAGLGVNPGSSSPSPVAVADSAVTEENKAVSVAVLANDTGGGGTLNPASVTVSTAAGHGTTAVNATTGAITYTPATGFYGTDTFRYTVADTDGVVSTPAAVTVTVDAPPVAAADSAVTEENKAVSIAVLANDTGGGGTLNPASVTVSTAAAHGTTAVNATTGAITYTPASGFYGTDTFRYTVADTDGVVSTPATVTVTVDAPPVAVADSAVTEENKAVSIAVLANDTDPVGTINPTTVAVSTAAAHGITAVNATTGAITYTPTSGFYGTDTFQYTVANTLGAASTPATVTVTVDAPPVAAADSAVTEENKAVSIAVLANDSDPVGTINPASVAVSTTPAHGTTAVNATTGAITYTPASGFSGTDTFRYTVANTLGGASAPATVTVTVDAAPIAVADNAATEESRSVSVAVLANDTGGGGTLNPASVTVSTAAGHGTTAVNATTGAITYTPATGFYGTDTFRYTVADTDGVVSTPATVTVTVDAPPVAVADSAVTPENQAVSVAVLANDTDPVGTINPATVAVSTAAAHGTTAVNATTGVITYTPASGFYGTDTFQYTVANTLGAASAPAAVTVTVTPLTGSGYVDGASGAPAGTPPLPAILSSYAVRPPWEVAGVDYAVGVPSGTTLKDPSTIAMAGVSVNTTNHTITVTGNNVTLNGYNFGMANGYEVIVQGVNDTIENSEFVVGPNQGSHGTVLNVTASASNFSLLDNEINGNNVAVTPEVGSTISIASSGTLTIQYNYLHNSGGDMIDLNASNAAQVDLIQYNLFANIGVNTAHADTIQWYNTTTGAGSDIGFNTVYQNVNQPGPGNGALVPLAEGPNATMTGLTVNNDTIVQTAADVTGNFSTGFYADSGGVASNIVIHDLYIDPTGPLGYTGSPWFPTGYYGINLAHPMALSNVINMVTGAQIPVPSSSSKTAQGYYTYADASGYSPALSDVYSVTASQTSGTLTPGSTISFTVNLDENFTVTGTPTLSLNDGGTATYSGGSGSNALTFSYTVASTDKTVSALAITGVTLPTGATVKDAVGNTANLAGAVATFAGLGVDPPGTTGSNLASSSTTSVISNAEVDNTPSVTETSDHGSLNKNLSQTGTYSVEGDSFVLSSGNAAAVTLGTGTSQIAFVGASTISPTGSASSQVAADTGNNWFAAGAGSLEVTGGDGKDTHLIHVTNGQLTIDNFSVENGDQLMFDKGLQGSMAQESDGRDRKLITFGSDGSHWVDVRGVAVVPSSSITWG